MAPEDKRQRFTVEINSHPVRAIISAGISTTMLNRKLAEQLGFKASGDKVSPPLKSEGVGEHELDVRPTALRANQCASR
jgi:hypothetical protein